MKDFSQDEIQTMMDERLKKVFLESYNKAALSNEFRARIVEELQIRKQGRVLREIAQQAPSVEDANLCLDALVELKDVKNIMQFVLTNVKTEEDARNYNAEDLFAMVCENARITDVARSTREALAQDESMAETAGFKGLRRCEQIMCDRANREL